MSGTPPPVWRPLGLVFAFTAGCGCTLLVTQHMAETGTTPPQRRLAEVVSATENQHGCAPTPREAVAAMLAANRNRLSDKTKRHGYQAAYGPVLAPFIRKPIRLLEIGMESGASVKLWSNLFPNLRQMYGIAYAGADENQASVAFARGQGLRKGRSKSHPSDKLTLFHGDQSDVAFLRTVAADLNGTSIDVIIDDGSHVPQHQLVSFVQLFPTLADGGLYIIEDVETSYWDRKGGAELFGYKIEAGIGTRGSAVESFKQLPDVLNRQFLGDPSYSIFGAQHKQQVDHRIASVAFSRNCIIVTKKVSTEWKQLDNLDRGGYMLKNMLDPTREQYKAFRAARGRMNPIRKER